MKKIKTIAVTLSAIVLFTGAVNAGTSNKILPTVVTVPTTEPLSVSYLGEDANYLYFQVAVIAGSNKTVSFAVSDRVEGELYSIVFSCDKVQTYKIEKREGQELEFNLEAGKKTFSKSFSSTQKGTLASL